MVRFNGTATMATAANTAATTMIQRREGFHEGDRSRSTQAQPADAATLIAAAPRAQIRSRSFHCWYAPVATSAAIAGAKATV
jgi:hypothetical protein